MDSLPISHLSAHGFSPRLIERWRETGIDSLLPLQIQGVRDYAFLQGRNLLVLAPTSSGKTFVAELAALKHMEEGRRAVYLVPTKALAEEKARQMNARYRPLGYRVAVATRERPETDRIVAEGRFDLLIAVYEKMKAYLVARPDLLSQVGLVVVDEIQSLGDRKRGEGLDLLLAKIVSAPYKTQFIGLSAVLGEGNRLADWLQCDLLLHRERPVELREGVLECQSGLFHYRSVNSGQEGDEELAPDSGGFPDSEEDGAEGATLGLTSFLAEGRNEQALIFVPTRPLSRRWAIALSDTIQLPPAEEAVAELERFEETVSRDLLLQCLRSGVAFHNADLSSDLRALIEEQYRRGAIRVVVSTPTLGQGVNLTGRNVIQVARMADTDPWTGETVIVPISIARWRNQGGRAGRFSLESDYGRSILLASGPDEAERLMRRYVSGSLEPLETPLRGRPLGSGVIDLAASNLAADRESAMRMLLQTYTGIAHWGGAEGELGQALDEAVGLLEEAQLLRRRPGGGFQATGLGKSMALHGLARETSIAMSEWLNSLGARQPEPFETLLVLSSAADGAEFPTPLTYQERSEMDYAADARERLEAECETCAPLREILWPAGGFTAREMAALKKAFLLEGWIGGAETAALEERFGVLAGTMSNLAGHVHWLARALLDCAEALGLAHPLRETFRNLADRLPMGLEENALGLSRLRVDGLSRGAIHALVREGYDSMAALLEAPEEELQRLLPKQTADHLIEELRYLKEERERPPQPAEEGEHPQRPAPRLRIDLSDPGRAWLEEQSVELTPLPYKLLLALAQAAPKAVSRERLAQELWPDASVEDQQISHHARSIAKAFAAIIGDQCAKDLIVSRRGHGLALQIPQESILIEEA